MSSVIKSKTTIILILFVVFAVSLIANSYGQEPKLQTDKTEKVYLQIQVRTSEGKLVAYIEPTVQFVYHPELLDKYLDKKPNKSIVTIDGKRFEKIQFEDIGAYAKSFTLAQYIMLDLDSRQPFPILTLIHNGCPVVPGDNYLAFWTILRPLS